MVIHHHILKITHFQGKSVGVVGTDQFQRVLAVMLVLASQMLVLASLMPVLADSQMPAPVLASVAPAQKPFDMADSLVPEQYF